MIGRPASDPAYFPCYAKCVELGVPVSIHTSADWTRTRLSDLGHPRHIDDVACRFPELTILMSHGGVNTAVNAQSAQRRRKCLIADLTVCRPALDLGYRHDRRGGSTRGDSPRP